MSEPVTNREIEDVLSAVRRLVSETGAPRREERASEMAGKLVLTPAFRVDNKPEPVVEAVPEAPMHADAPDVQEASVEALVQDTVDAAPEANIAESDESGAPEDGQPDAIDAALAALKADSGAEVGETSAAGPAPEDSVAEVTETLEERIAELEAVVTAPETEEWEPDGSEEADAPRTVLFRHSTPFASVSDPEPTDAPEADADPVDLSEAPFAEAADWEDVEEEAMSFGAGPETLEAEEETLYSAADYDDADTTPLSGEGDGDDMVIDEDMLREIVGRLVREELQGTMGERITRNLRRMVRREIARAMALKDFD
jgi:hypothetical protein